jgi:hypothetical protein
MEPLQDLERAVLDLLAAGDVPSMRQLQEQIATCAVPNRELTGTGFFTTLDVDRGSVAPVEGLPSRSGDVHLEIEGLAHGAGFVLFIEDGYIRTLEGYPYDEPWPDAVGDFRLSRFEGTRKKAPSSDS